MGSVSERSFRLLQLVFAAVFVVLLATSLASWGSGHAGSAPAPLRWAPAGGTGPSGSAPGGGVAEASTIPASSLPFIERESMADDPADAEVLVFGGQDPYGNPSAETLSFHAGTWSNVSAGLLSSPPARWGAMMAYDPVDSEVVLFGGCQTLACAPGLSDTWTFAGGTWTDRTSTVGTPPAARGMADLAWDSTGQSLILFGGGVGFGTSGQTHYFGDTWSFVHNHWTNLSSNLTGATPPARQDAAMSSVPSGGLALFAGEGDRVIDTWTYANGSWANVTSTSGSLPPDRHGAMFAPDPSTGYALLTGGYWAGSYLGDFWAFSSGHWSKLSFSSGPPPTYAGGMAWDSTDQELVFYGGVISAGQTNGAWTLSGGAWALENPKSNTSGLIFLLLFVVIALVLFVPMMVGHFTRLRRERKLQALFPTPSSADLLWVPAASPRRMYRQGLITGAILFGILGPFSLIIFVPLLTSGSLGLSFFVPFLLIELLVLLVLPLVIVLTQFRFATRSIGVCSSGVIVQRKVGEIRVPWAYLSPPEFGARNGLVFFRYYFTGGGEVRGAFAADLEQAKAVLRHPNAQSWTLTEPLRRSLGIFAPLPPVAPGPYYPGATGPAYGAAAPPPSRPLPSTAPPQYSRAPPAPASAPTTYTPSFPPVPSRGLPPPPPPGFQGQGTAPMGAPRRAQLKRCPACGSLQGMSSVYCSRCGAPVA